MSVRNAESVAFALGRNAWRNWTYSDLLNRLEGFDPWLTSLGLIPRSNDRIHEAFKVLRRAEEASRKGHETGTYINIRPEDWFPIVEALEAHDVLAAFHNDPSPAIAPALKRALSGPMQPIDDNPKNRDGRNIWYELALAAESRLRGVSVSLEEPDLPFTEMALRSWWRANDLPTKSTSKQISTML